MNDRRNGLPKPWILKRKNKQRGTTSRCRSCRNEQQDGELSISVVGLYVPYEQNFVVETTFYFCPNAGCIKRLPPWVNLTPPTRITIDSSVTREKIQSMRDSPCWFDKGNILNVFNYPLLLPATRSFYPLPAPNRYSRD